MNSERACIEKVLAGDAAAFDDLVHEHGSYVFRIAGNMVAPQDVEEVAQEAFIRAFRDLRSYRFQAPFRHWLARIAVRACYDHWRRERRRRLVPVDDQQLRALELEASELRRGEEAAVERAREILGWALAHLAPPDRLAFSLLYLEDVPMREAAGMMGWSLAKIKARSFRARRALRKLLAARKADDEEETS